MINNIIFKYILLINKLNKKNRIIEYKKLINKVE